MAPRRRRALEGPAVLMSATATHASDSRSIATQNYRLEENLLTRKVR